MRNVIVRYRLKPDRVAENEQLVRDVYLELARANPGGIRYATYKLPDGVSFVHVASIDGENPLPRLTAFQTFTRAIAERCDEPPVTTEVTAIGRYPA